MPQDSRTLYQILGVHRDAKASDIERAHKRLRAEIQQETVAPDPRRAMLVRNAYEVLSDPARREAYDESLRAPASMLRRAGASRRAQAAAIAVAVAALGIGAYFALRADPALDKPRDPREIAEAASLAVGRIESIDVGGGTTQLGLAFALQQGALATHCRGFSPTTQLVVTFAQRKVPARIATMYEREGVCRLTAEGLGSWPLPLRGSRPAPGDRIYATKIGANGQLALAEGTVRRVFGDEGGTIVEVNGPASLQLAGGPLLDAQGRVIGVGEGGGRYRSVPPEWIAEMRGPVVTAPPKPTPKPVPAPPKDPLNAEERARKLRPPDDI